ncbi:hypothetical protein RI367_006603 [Sorochytrium milnesiophthora]
MAVKQQTKRKRQEQAEQQEYSAAVERALAAAETAMHEHHCASITRLQTALSPAPHHFDAAVMALTQTHYTQVCDAVDQDIQAARTAREQLLQQLAKAGKRAKRMADAEDARLSLYVKNATVEVEQAAAQYGAGWQQCLSQMLGQDLE